MSNGKNLTKRLIKKRIMTAFEWKTFFVWRVTYICVHVTQAQFLPTSSKHVSPGMQFLRLGIGGLSHQSCMSLHIGTSNVVGGSISIVQLKFGVDIQRQLKLESRNKKIQYGHLAAILKLTLLKINRLLHIYISIVPLKFGVDIQGQTKVRVWKPKTPIWSPGGHFESDVAENQ